jgi:hypothetical protein
VPSAIQVAPTAISGVMLGFTEAVVRYSALAVVLPTVLVLAVSDRGATVDDLVLHTEAPGVLVAAPWGLSDVRCY